MNWNALGALGELVGAAAVLATLVYLSIQIRANSLQVRLGSAISLNHLINEAFDPIYNNDRNIHIWTHGISSPETLNDQDQAIFSLFMSRLVNVHLTALIHDQHAILESDLATRFLGSLKSILESPGGKYWMTELGGSSQISPKELEALVSATDLKEFLVRGVSAKE